MVYTVTHGEHYIVQQALTWWMMLLKTRMTTSIMRWRAISLSARCCQYLQPAAGVEAGRSRAYVVQHVCRRRETSLWMHRNRKPHGGGVVVSTIQDGPKKPHTKLIAIILSNLNRFSKFPHVISPQRLTLETSGFVHGSAMWSLSLVRSECSLSGRGQGYVSNFYIVDLENFATASRR